MHLLGMSKRMEPIEIDAIGRWDVFYRLQELAIPCQCDCHQPLRVQADTATAAIQIWSVIRQITSPRSVVADYLERCFHQQVAL